MSLLEVVNTTSSEKKQVRPAVSKTSSDSINADRRPATDLKQLLTEVLGEDRAFAQVFDKTAYLDNSQVQEQIANAEHEFYRLLELVLFDYNVSEGNTEGKAQQEALFAQLCRPRKEGNFDNLLHLRVIDTYCSNLQGRAVVRDAVELIKPFFIQQQQEMIN